MIPSYLQNKPVEIQQKFLEVKREFMKRSYSEEEAFIAAGKWLLNQKAPQAFIKRSIVSFEVDSSQGLLKRSAEGDEYVSLKLGSTQIHPDGIHYSEDVLKKWANDINSGNTIIGDIDHTEYDKLLASGLTDNEIKSMLKSKKGIGKSIKAVVQDGILWVRALIDKRYRNIVEKSKGVSAEALVTYGQNGEVVDGDLLGFSFNVLSTPADPQAGVVS